MTHYKFWMVFAEGCQAPNKRHYTQAEADFAIMAGEFAQMLPQLVEALGGENESA